MVSKLLLIVLMILFVVSCSQPSSNPSNPSNPSTPNQPSNPSSFIITPVSGQQLAGTVSLAASSSGILEELEFELGGVKVFANSDLTASLNTRDLTDGDYTLVATAKLAGTAVRDELRVSIKNNLSSEATVDSAGGVLKSEDGSYAIIPPGALSNSATVRVKDLSQEEILAEFGVDYEALGITFLGALELEAEGLSETDLPIQVDLAGWTEAVQPRQQVLMFSLAPDADGDGIGELMFAASAEATADGSVITRPVAKTDVSDLKTVSGQLVSQQNASIKPGELVSLNAYGFLPGGTLSNTVTVAGKELLIGARLSEATSFNPLMELSFYMPLLDTGEQSAVFKNLSTGFSSDTFAFQLTALGLAPEASWLGFVEQLSVAISKLSENRPDVASLMNASLRSFESQSDSNVFAMIANSNLVSAANLAHLETISTSQFDSVQRDLLTKHALLLDALAVSFSSLGASASDLASLLLLSQPSSNLSSSQLTTQDRTFDPNNPEQDDGPGGSSCGGGSSRSLGSTGMGSAIPAGGSACGGSGGQEKDPNLTVQRLGSFGPVEGAIVSVYRRDSSQKLSPFSDLTDEAGFYQIPFVAEGEPFTVKALDPATGQVATANGVGVPLGQGVTVPLIFAAREGCPDKEGYNLTWTGFVSDDWYTAENWSLGRVPTIEDDVYICADAPRQPKAIGNISTTSADVRNLLVESGAVIESIQPLNVWGNLEALGKIEMAPRRSVVMRTAESTVQGNVTNLLILAAVDLVGPTTLTGDLSFLGNAKTELLRLNGFSLVVFGDLSAPDNAFAMTIAKDRLTTHGKAFIGLGTFSNGILEVKGDLDVAEGFANTGNHQIILSASEAQVISQGGFPSADSTHFRNLLIQSTASVTFTSSLGVTPYILGDLSVEGSAELLGSVTVSGELRSVAGTTLNLDLLRLAGTMNIAGAFNPVITEFVGQNQAIQAGLAYQKLLIRGTASLESDTSAIAVEIRGTPAIASLDLAGHKLSVAEDFEIPQFGTFKMLNPSDYLLVEGNTILNSGDGAGLLLAGIMELKGDFETGTGSRLGFAPSGDHEVVLSGTQEQTISLRFPNSTEHHFNNLTVRNSAGVSFLTNADVLADLELSGQMTIPVGRSVTVAQSLTLEADSTLINNGNLSVTTCTNNGGLISGTGNNPCE